MGAIDETERDVRSSAAPSRSKNEALRMLSDLKKRTKVLCEPAGASRAMVQFFGGLFEE
jgi:hypothetical protein